MKPFFTIVVPCCDVAKYVRECFDSFADDDFRDWECIAGVEESKDGTEDIVRSYTLKDGRFRMFTSPRTGSCYASRNTALGMATGEYVIFLDGDDTVEKGSLGRLHDMISARPGADLYPCAIRVTDDKGETVEMRDNYPAGFSKELTGAEATLFTGRAGHHPCPMLQITVFRREFLAVNKLECIRGLRRQDSEFSPRALYLAKRVAPLHEPFYIYRLHGASVSSMAKGAGYFHKDWATIIRSLLAFHASVSTETGFDRRLTACWRAQWLPWIFYFWFAPASVRTIPAERRHETLSILFPNGFGDLDRLLVGAPLSKRIAASWVKAYVRFRAARPMVKLLFAAYFALSKAKHAPS